MAASAAEWVWMHKGLPNSVRAAIGGLGEEELHWQAPGARMSTAGDVSDIRDAERFNSRRSTMEVAMTKDKFARVPVEPDTRIVSQSHGAIDDLDALHQRWTWEGVSGENLVFVSEEVKGLGDQELKGLVRGSGLVEDGSDITIKRNEHGFTFVNFNFECD